MRTYGIADVGHGEPQGEDDGQQDQVGGLLASGVGPLQRQRLLHLLLRLLLFLVGVAHAGLAAVLDLAGLLSVTVPGAVGFPGLGDRFLPPERRGRNREVEGPECTVVLVWPIYSLLSDQLPMSDPKRGFPCGPTLV